VVQNLKV